MRTKTLLIAAAALAVGIVTSTAQTYSQNVVGYVTMTFPGANKMSLICSPLQGLVNGVATNGATEILTSLQTGDFIYVWHADTNGTGYYVYEFHKGFLAGGYPSDYYDVGLGNIPGDEYNEYADATFAPEPQLGPGVAYFVQTANKQTNTFTGTVVLSNTNSPVPIKANNIINMLGSVVPVGGDIVTDADLCFSNILSTGDFVMIWNGTGYYVYEYHKGFLAQGYPSDWYDVGLGNIPGDEYNEYADATFAPAPQMTVGQAWVYQSPNTNHWSQNVILQ